MSGVDTDVEVADAGASKTVPIQAGAVRKGTLVMIKGKPCKILEVTTSKTGKHGHAKANMMGVDIFTGKKYEDSCPTSHNMEQPVVNKFEYTLLDITADGFLSLLTEDGSEKSDLKLPEGEVGDKIRASYDAGETVIVCTLAALGDEAVVDSKTEK